MYERAVILTGLLLIAVTPLSGQVTELELERRIDSLAPVVEQAAVEAAEARLAAVEAVRLRAVTQRSLDTVQVTGVTIITPSSDAAEAYEFFSAVLAEGFPRAESRSLFRRTFTYQRAMYDVEGIPVDGVRQEIVVPAWLPGRAAMERVRRAVGEAIAADLSDTELGTWTGGNPFTVHDPARLYREAVVARSLAVERCLEGSVEACTAALGLGLGDDFLGVWYTPEQRRERVMAWAGYEDSPEGLVRTRGMNLYGTAIEGCVERSAPEACDAFIQSDYDVWTPLPNYMRETLVGTALDRGGPGAWGRLIEDPEMSVEEAISYAAGIPLDELVAQWRSWVVTNRPEAYAGIGAKSALALLWVLFFAALATRSTRWRSE